MQHLQTVVTASAVESEFTRPSPDGVAERLVAAGVKMHPDPKYKAPPGKRWDTMQGQFVQVPELVQASDGATAEATSGSLAVVPAKKGKKSSAGHSFHILFTFRVHAHLCLCDWKVHYFPVTQLNWHRHHALRGANIRTRTRCGIRLCGARQW